MKIIKHNSFNVIEGQYPIIISAPHSVMHTRMKCIKNSEVKTGILTQNISKSCKIYGIYKTKSESNDANWDRVCEYKKNIKGIIKDKNIKFLLDIHGMAEYREQDICIGINNGKNIMNKYDIIEEMIDIFKSNDFKNVEIDVPFNAEYRYCVSRDISKECKICTVQIEINAKYRMSKYKEYSKFNNLEKALKEIVEYLKVVV